MVKFDCGADRPNVFIENKLAILPVSRGDYVISNYKAYKAYELSDEPPRYFALPDHIQSLDADNIKSESMAINCAFASGILSDFLGEDILYPTVSGRMNSGKFTFDIDTHDTGRMDLVSVDNSQLEIDAAFEGAGSLALIEAKRELSSDFIIRQLYYPFRLWHDKERITKHIRPVFLAYSNGVFYLYEYKFTNPHYYNSLKLLKSGIYTIESVSVSLDDLHEILKNIELVPEPEAPFPQADKFERVINLCDMLAVKSFTTEEIAEQYTFVIRQSNYYTSAARYLGFIEKYRDENKNIAYSLTNYGRRIMKLKYKDRQVEFCKAILRHPVFHETLCRALKKGKIPEANEIQEILKEFRIKISGDTLKRRSSSVKDWIRWMINLTIQCE